jgi:hypothetical protein
MKTPYETLLEIIPDHPAMRIMHFAARPDKLSDALGDLTRTREYEYRLLAFDADTADALSQRYAHMPHIKTKTVSPAQKRFHIQAKLYDYIFVSCAIEDKAHFAKAIHSAIKNGGIILIITSDPHTDTEPWRLAFEEHFFVAFNRFELADGLHVISAKKMHGWGG